MYKNRIYAGEVLLKEIIKRGLEKSFSFLFAVPRGGIEVAYPIAKALKLPIIPLIIHKIPASYNSELAIGAVSIAGEVVLNELAEEEGEDYLENVKIRVLEELKRREKSFGVEFDYKKIKGKDVLLIDDGIATGETLFLAAKTLHNFQPAKVYIAAPVSSMEGYSKLLQFGGLLCPVIDRYFYAVSQYYEEFPQLSEDKVKEYIQNSAKFAAS